MAFTHFPNTFMADLETGKFSVRINRPKADADADGTRTVVMTLSTDIIPEEHHPYIERRKGSTPGMVPFWDCNTNKWREFHFKNLISYEPVTE